MQVLKTPRSGNLLLDHLAGHAVPLSSGGTPENPQAAATISVKFKVNHVHHQHTPDGLTGGGVRLSKAHVSPTKLSS